MSGYSYKNNTNNFKRSTDYQIKLQKQKTKILLEKNLKDELPTCLQQIDEHQDHQKKNRNSPKSKRNYENSFNKRKQIKSKQKKIAPSPMKNINQKINQNKSNIQISGSHKFSILKVLQSQDPSNIYRYKDFGNEPKKSSLQEIQIKITQLIEKGQKFAQQNNKQSFNHYQSNIYPEKQKYKLSVTDQFILSGYIALYLKQIKLGIGQKVDIQDQFQLLKQTWQLYELKLKMCPDIWGDKDKLIFQELKALSQSLNQIQKKETNLRNIIKKFNAIIVT